MWGDVWLMDAIGNDIRSDIRTKEWCLKESFEDSSGREK